MPSPTCCSCTSHTATRACCSSCGCSGGDAAPHEAGGRYGASWSTQTWGIGRGNGIGISSGGLSDKLRRCGEDS